MPRELRSLVPVEIAIVIAIAAIPWPEQLPIALPLVTAASIARWVRGRSWTEVIGSGGTLVWVGLAAGFAALALALVVGTPVVETFSMRSVEWSSYPIVRGNFAQLAVVLVIVIIAGVAMEMALRGWLVERVLELSPGSPVLPVMCGAFAEAIVTPGDIAARIGAGIFGAGLGWMYIASRQSIVAPVLARIAFQGGALLLEGLRLIG